MCPGGVVRVARQNKHDAQQRKQSLVELFGACKKGVLQRDVGVIPYFFFKVILSISGGAGAMKVRKRRFSL